MFYQSASSVFFTLVISALLVSVTPCCAETTGFKSLSLSQFETITPRELLIQNDVLYKKSMKYQGFPLSKVFKALGQKEVNLIKKVVFHCSDGYKAELIPSEHSLDAAYLVSAELTEAAGTRLEDIPEGATTLSPAPFLLVWDVQNSAHLPTPHGIIGIEFITEVTDTEFTSNPTHDDSVKEGHKLFSTYCKSCHMVNQDGGTVGPELNVPRNVTEYFTEDYIKAFIKNPSAFRFRSRMIPPAVNESQINRIYEYLKSMKNHKACNSHSECLEHFADS